MTNNSIIIKIKQRLNKLDSQDFDNLECWQISEAINKAQLEFVRSVVHGNNQHQEGDEGSKMTIDDIQVILVPQVMNATKHSKYYETTLLPDDYLYFKRISVNSITECCDPRALVVYLKENADVDNLILDILSKPSAEWGETFATISSNKIKIYTNGEFELDQPILLYYRKPREMKIIGCSDLDGNVITVESTLEFKDDVVELIIDKAASILAADIESINQYSIRKQEHTTNN